MMEIFSKIFCFKRIFNYQASLWSFDKVDTTSVSFSSSGTRLFTMQKARPSCVFSTLSPEPLFICMDTDGYRYNKHNYVYAFRFS